MAHQSESPEAVVAPETHTVDSAAAALSQAFQADPEEEQQEDPNTNDEIPEDGFDLEEGEEIEGEDDEQDEPEEPAIDAPVSLKADEKAEYASLDPKAQDFVTRLEQRRNEDVQKVTTKAAEAQRQAEAKTANAQKEAEALLGARLKAVADAFAPQEPDPNRYQNMEHFRHAQAQYREAIAQHEEFMQQVGQIGVETDEMRIERIKARDAELLKIPEVANEETREEYFKSALSVAEALGYDKDELIENMEAGDIKALGMAAKWKADSEKLAELRAKSKERKRDPKSGKFRSMKPGAAQPQRSGNRAFSEASQRLAKSGSLEDAQAAFKAIL